MLPLSPSRFELCEEQPCLRVRYMLPGLSYTPDADATRIAPSPRIAAPKPPPPKPEPAAQLVPVAAKPKKGKGLHRKVFESLVNLKNAVVKRN